MGFGLGYVQLLTRDDGAPAEICTLRPERVSVVSDERGWPTAYLYRVAGRVTRYERMDALGRRQMAHLKSLHPRETIMGWGASRRLARRRRCTMEQDDGASRWNKALLDNAARPSGALVYDPADGSTLSTDQFARLKEELAAESSGSGNAGRPLLLEGGLKWQTLSMTPADMDFVALKEGAARDIALAFGVPPVLVGLPGDATHANAREVRMQTTPRLGLWTGIPGQAQKETSINEALHLLDAIVEAAIEESARADPPATPVVGTTYVVADQATGEWSGHEGALAAFTPGGWRYVAPTDGLTVLEKTTGSTLRYRSGAWEQVLGAPQAAIPDVTGGATIDVESRATIAAILNALRAHGLIAA